MTTQQPTTSWARAVVAKVVAFFGLDGPGETHPEESVERRWFDKAAAGAFVDVLLVTSLALGLVSIYDLTVDGLDVLLAVVVLAVLAVAARYVVISRRES